jgi:hypothetical protein
MICVFIIKNVYKSIPNEKKNRKNKSTAEMRFTKNVIKTQQSDFHNIKIPDDFIMTMKISSTYKTDG